MDWAEKSVITSIDDTNSLQSSELKSPASSSNSSLNNKNVYIDQSITLLKWYLGLRAIWVCHFDLYKYSFKLVNDILLTYLYLYLYLILNQNRMAVILLLMYWKMNIFLLKAKYLNNLLKRCIMD